MAIGKITRGGLAGIVVRWASGLRFPYLFLLTAAVFILDLFIPDMVPVADELIIGLVAVMLANLRQKPEAGATARPIPGETE